MLVRIRYKYKYIGLLDTGTNKIVETVVFTEVVREAPTGIEAFVRLTAGDVLLPLLIGLKGKHHWLLRNRWCKEK